MFVKNPKIVSAATRVFFKRGDSEDQEEVMICSPRHWDSVAHATFKAMGNNLKKVKDIQGFVDQYGDFHTRKEAYVIAVKNNQIIRRVGGDDEKLFSENLY